MISAEIVKSFTISNLDSVEVKLCNFYTYSNFYYITLQRSLKNRSFCNLNGNSRKLIELGLENNSADSELLTSIISPVSKILILAKLCDLCFSREKLWSENQDPLFLNNMSMQVFFTPLQVFNHFGILRNFLRTVTMSSSDPNYDRSFLGNELSKSFEDLFTMT